MTAKRKRKWREDILKDLVANAIWASLIYLLKPVAAASLATFLALVAAIRRLLPGTTWYDAMISAGLITLAFVVPLFVIAVLVKSSIPSRSKTAKVAEIMRAGRVLRKCEINLPTETDAAAWVLEVDGWEVDTADFLKECSPQALEKFLDDSSEGARTDYSVSHLEARHSMRKLQQRLANLSKIIDAPDVYL